MSIPSVLVRLEQNGKLLRYQPDSCRTVKRRLYLSKRAVSDYNDNGSAANILVGRGYFRNAFDRWTLGNLIPGGRLRGRFIVPLHPPPPHIWEIKITEPVAQGRAFGRFIEPDTFIVTHLHTRRFLDENDAWLTSMQDCSDIWNALFPTTLPFVGASIHDYIKENCDDFPIITRAPKPRGRR